MWGTTQNVKSSDRLGVVVAYQWSGYRGPYFGQFAYGDQTLSPAFIETYIVITFSSLSFCIRRNNCSSYIFMTSVETIFSFCLWGLKQIVCQAVTYRRLKIIESCKQPSLKVVAYERRSLTRSHCLQEVPFTVIWIGNFVYFWNLGR